MKKRCRLSSEVEIPIEEFRGDLIGELHLRIMLPLQDLRHQLHNIGVARPLDSLTGAGTVLV